MRHSGGEVSDCQVIGRHWVAMGSKMMGEHPRTGRVDGEQAKESGPGLSSWEVAGSGPVAPPVGADSERNTGADDPCASSRVGCGVPVRKVKRVKRHFSKLWDAIDDWPANLDPHTIVHELDVAGDRKLHPWAWPKTGSANARPQRSINSSSRAQRRRMEVKPV